MSLKILFFLLGPSLTFGHTRLVSPTPRNNDSGIKAGPCGALARSVSPTKLVGGQNLMVQWEETIDHPGRFIISLSLANDANFSQLATILDDQNLGNNLPHVFKSQIVVPDIDCPACTLQMVQSMEENPAAPTYYYSCADIIIQKSTSVPTPAPAPPPSPVDVSAQSSTLPLQSSEVKFGQGCGAIKKSVSARNTSAQALWAVACLFALLIPVLAWIRLRVVHLTSTRR